MPAADEIYFVYFVDCEPLRERSPACGGPASWEVSERTVQGIRETFEAGGLRDALTFNLTPEAARAHAPLMRRWHEDGVHLGIQPNVPGFRYPAYEKDLGQYDEATQRRIIREATEDFEDAIGFRPTGYCACCGSKSPVTPRLLYEAGYRQYLSPAPGRYFPDRPDRASVGIFPYPHWGNERHHLVPGRLPICVIPCSGEMSGGRGVRPRDVRSEAPVGEETRELYRRIIDWNIELSGLIDAPVRAIVGATHNSEYVHLENVAYVLDYVREAVAREGLRLVPASYDQVSDALQAAAPVAAGAPAGAR
jgi:hypothetical protein